MLLFIIKTFLIFFRTETVRIIEQALYFVLKQNFMKNSLINNSKTFLLKTIIYIKHFKDTLKM